METDLTKSYFTIGRIVNTQGIKGDVRVLPATDDPKRFERLDRVDVFFERPGAPPRTLTIEKVWYHKGFVILKFAEIPDMTAADALKNGVIKIPPEKALPLEPDEYYLRDVYDMDVTTADGEALGAVVDILQTGANDVYVVQDSDGRQILIPAIKQCVLHMDAAAKKMTVDLPEGLRAL